MVFPTEIFDKIALHAFNATVSEALRPVITDTTFWRTSRENVLVYGPIQSGKTKKIVELINNPVYKHIQKVLVIQNSLMVLEQYSQRLLTEGIDYEIIDKFTQKITKNVIIVMNNQFRYGYFKKANKKEEYILLLDEADQTYKSCPLEGYKNFYITATPFDMNISFHRTITIEPPLCYYDLSKSVIQEQDSLETIAREFQVDGGMMLINTWTLVEEMLIAGYALSQAFPDIPVVVLSTYKRLFLNGVQTILKKSSISHIIDDLQKHRSIIFIANRVANRGISFVSSDYSRHLTHQISRVPKSTTQFMQGLRLLGVYYDRPTLKLYITPENRKTYDAHLVAINALSV
jgi:hypothetical protein